MSLHTCGPFRGHADDLQTLQNRFNLSAPLLRVRPSQAVQDRVNVPPRRIAEANEFLDVGKPGQYRVRS